MSLSDSDSYMHTHHTCTYIIHVPEGSFVFAHMRGIRGCQCLVFHVSFISPARRTHSPRYCNCHHHSSSSSSFITPRIVHNSQLTTHNTSCMGDAYARVMYGLCTHRNARGERAGSAGRACETSNTQGMQTNNKITKRTPQMITAEGSRSCRLAPCPRTLELSVLDVRVVLDPVDEADLHAGTLVVLRLSALAVEVHGRVVDLVVVDVGERCRRVVLVAVVLREDDRRGGELLGDALEERREDRALEVVEENDDVLVMRRLDDLLLEVLVRHLDDGASRSHAHERSEREDREALHVDLMERLGKLPAGTALRARKVDLCDRQRASLAERELVSGPSQLAARKQKGPLPLAVVVCHTNNIGRALVGRNSDTVLASYAYLSTRSSCLDAIGYY